MIETYGRHTVTVGVIAMVGCVQISGVNELRFDRTTETGLQADAYTLTDTGFADAMPEDQWTLRADVTDAQVEEVAMPRDKPPFLRNWRLVCKLINGRSESDPTINDTHKRANISGTDLGISVRNDRDLYFFFGDTIGAFGIWQQRNSSLAKAVGYSAAGYNSTKQRPELLCNNLRFLVSDQATGKADADFAPTTMEAPAGDSIGQYIRNSAHDGNVKYDNMPGSLEVPTGAFSHNGEVFVFYSATGDDLSSVKSSYLAKWKKPSTTTKPQFDILYHLDTLQTPSEGMGGHFINISPIVNHQFVYLFGTGEFRHSAVYLARKPLERLSQPGGFEYYNSFRSSWSTDFHQAVPIVVSNAVGELSVRHFASVGYFTMMSQELISINGIKNNNCIVARFAPAAEEPWSHPITLTCMSEEQFNKIHCCKPLHPCEGQQILQCLEAGFYATYLLPDPLVHPDTSFSLFFTLSTYIPRNVVLMEAIFQ